MYYSNVTGKILNNTKKKWEENGNGNELFEFMKRFSFCMYHMYQLRPYLLSSLLTFFYIILVDCWIFIKLSLYMLCIYFLRFQQFFFPKSQKRLLFFTFFYCLSSELVENILLTSDHANHNVLYHFFKCIILQSAVGNTQFINSVSFSTNTTNWSVYYRFS